MSSSTKRIDGTNIILLNDQNAVLLQLRDNKPTIPYPNMWAIPGGHIDQGETPLECILREVKEELGIELDEAALFVAAERSYGREHTYWARARFCLEDVKLSEGQGVQWFTYDEIKNIQLIYEDNGIIEEFFQQKPFENDISGGSRQMSNESIKKRSLNDVPMEPTRNGALKRVLLRHEDVDSPFLMFLNEVYVRPGETITAHQHEDMEEVFYFLEGEGIMQIGLEEVRVASGDRIIVPMKTAHILTNTNDTEMKFICFGVKAVPQAAL
jgi:8-oxo-dGTP diphosphatase